MTEPLFREDSYWREVEARVLAAAPGAIVLDGTVFYARGGGQSGDRGRFVLADGSSIEILDTVYDADRRTILHVPAEGARLPAAGESLMARLDWDLRFSRMRAHSALHLLTAVLPYPVTGGSVGDGEGRLLEAIVEAIKATLEVLSPDLAADLMENGMVLCGGGSLTRGIDRFLAEQTGLPVRVAAEPLTAVARGTLICLEHLEQWRPTLDSSDDDV